MRHPARSLRVTLDALLIAGAVAMPLALATGHVAPLAVTLAALWIARVVLRRGRSIRSLAPSETTLILAVLLIVYLGNGRTLTSGDSIPARHLPLSILRAGSLALDDVSFLYAECVPYYLKLVDGHYVSAYPVGAALLALPLYVPAALAGVAPSHPLLVELEKLAAAITVALSAVLLYHAARRIASRRMALFATAAYALGGSSLSVSSQALWQHGASQLGLAAALYCLLRGDDEPIWLAYAGLPLSFAVLARPTDALMAGAIALYVFWRRPSRFVFFLLAGVPPAVFQLWYNARYFGTPFRTQWDPFDAETWSGSFWPGLAGLLLSPGRGLFVYSPIFALSVVGFVLAWRRNGHGLLRALGVAAGLTLLLYAKWEMWWGGLTFGPRLLADLTPVLALGLCPAAPLLARRRALRVTAAALLAWSIGVHAVGAFAHDYYWNAYADVDRSPGRLWSWTDNQVVNPVRQVLGRVSLVLAGHPTHRTAPELVAAVYAPARAPSASVTPSPGAELALAARNVGRAAWLAWPRDADDVMMLVWRWRRPDDGTLAAGGGLPLYHDVVPGQSHDFRIDLEPPAAPGSYVLEVGLARKRGGCVSPIASPDLRLPVTVTASTAERPRARRRCPAGPVRPSPPACPAAS
jgi:hypothetical protein